MKLQQSLICALVVGISSGATLTSCRQDDVKSGIEEPKSKAAEQKEKPSPFEPSEHNCPACGMG